MSNWINTSKNSAIMTGLTKHSSSFSNPAKSFKEQFLLLESGDYLLLETGDRIILEQSIPNNDFWDHVTKS